VPSRSGNLGAGRMRWDGCPTRYARGCTIRRTRPLLVRIFGQTVGEGLRALPQQKSQQGGCSGTGCPTRYARGCTIRRTRPLLVRIFGQTVGEGLRALPQQKSQQGGCSGTGWNPSPTGVRFIRRSDYSSIVKTVPAERPSTSGK